MKSHFLAAVLCLMSVGSLFAASHRIVSPDGSRSLVFDDTGVAVYHSGNGTISMARIASRGRQDFFHLTAMDS